MMMHLNKIIDKLYLLFKINSIEFMSTTCIYL